MHYPSDEFGAKIPVYVLTCDGDIVKEESSEGRLAMQAFEYPFAGGVSPLFEQPLR